MQQPNPQVASMLASFRSGATGGFPGPAGQGSTPGAVSPLFNRWNSQSDLGARSNWGQVYDAAIGLPRTWDTYISGQFLAGMPIYPVPIDIPEEPSGRPRPRRYQYPINWNLPVGVPGTEGVKLASFQQLRDLAEPQSVTRSCIELVKQDMIGLDWDVVPTADAQRAMQSNPKKRVDFEKRKAEVMELFLNPDPDMYDGFDEWMNALVEDSTVIDAVAIYIQPAGGKGNGPCGSDVGGLALLDGSTIRPQLAIDGSRPRPPEVSYQSYIWGVPRVDLMDLINLGPQATLEDIKQLDPVLWELTERGDEWDGDQMIYFRTNPRSWLPYGFGPVEQGILASSIMQARMTWQFEFFRNGSLPAVFLDPGESIANAEEARQIQEAINMLGGDLGGMHQVIVLPPGAKAMPQKEVDLTSQFDEWVTALIVMPFGYSISDLGITPKVAALQSPAASKTAAVTATDRSVRRAVIPRAKKMKTKIFDRIIQGKLGQKDMEWSWGITDQGESQNDLVSQQTSLVKSSISTIDEARIKLELDPLGLPETTVPLVFTATGAVPLHVAVQLALNPPTQSAGSDNTTKPGSPGGPALDAESKPTPAKPKPSGGTTKPPTGKPGSPPSPAHAASEAVVNRPARTRVSPEQSKAVGDELAVLRRYLSNGRDISRFRSDIIPASALKAASGDTPYALAASVGKALRRAEHKRRALAGPRKHLSAALAAAAGSLTAGRHTRSAFMAAAVAALAAAMAAAFKAGAAMAAEEAPASVDLDGFDDADWDNRGQTAAEAQRPYLSGFADDVAAGMSAAMMAARADLYAGSLSAGYEKGYVAQGTATADVTDEPRIVWHLGDAEHCDLCSARDGQSYTAASLPGYPGDGGFGDLCEGGVNCACTLELVYGDRRAETDTSLGRQINLGQAPAADLTRSIGKDFSLGSPVGSGFVPFDLEAGVHSLYPSPLAGREVAERFESEEAARRALEAIYDPSEYEVVGDAICVKAVDASRARDAAGQNGHGVPAVQAAAEPEVRFAGLAVRAEDTGRVLLIQRAVDDQDDRPDPAGGRWELPGGHLDDGELPWAAAVREWSEEVGHSLPDGRVVSTWVCPNGYQGFVYAVEHEIDVDLGAERSVENPDGDRFEAVAWFAIADLVGMPSLRPELAADLPMAELRMPVTKAAVAADPAAPASPSPPRLAGRSIGEKRVRRYLATHYPNGDLGWVARCLWTVDNVLLDDIDWDHRPGGIDAEHVADMAERIEAGHVPHEVVLVAPAEGARLAVADGYHRCAAFARLGRGAIPAWVAVPKPGNTGWAADVQAMQHTVENHAANKSAGL